MKMLQIKHDTIAIILLITIFSLKNKYQIILTKIGYVRLRRVALQLLVIAIALNQNAIAMLQNTHLKIHAFLSCMIIFFLSIFNIKIHKNIQIINLAIKINNQSKLLAAILTKMAIDQWKNHDINIAISHLASSSIIVKNLFFILYLYLKKLLSYS